MGLYWDNAKENGNYYGIIGYIGILPPPVMENHMEKKMENEMETLGPLKGICRDITPIMENQMEKQMEIEMETVIMG